jgi:hypothetical protein
MFENARELAERLSALHGSQDYKVEATIFDKENHSVTAWAALARGIPFAFECVMFRKLGGDPTSSIQF